MTLLFLEIHVSQSTCTEKHTKYVDLKIEAAWMWRSRRVAVIHIIVGALGSIPIHACRNWIYHLTWYKPFRNQFCTIRSQSSGDMWMFDAYYIFNLYMLLVRARLVYLPAVVYTLCILRWIDKIITPTYMYLPSTIPPWKVRLQHNISVLRKELSQLDDAERIHTVSLSCTLAS